jgi:hypothetical protein
MKKIILISLVFFISIAFVSQAYASGMTSSFVFSQESLQNAFQDISTTFNVPIVVDQTVLGNVTMNLNNVTLEQAVETLCKGYGLFYFNYNGVYFVGTSSSALSMQVAGYSERVIDLKYVSSTNAMQFLQPYANYITYAPSYPYLFFFGPDNIYNKVVSTVAMFDKPGSNVYIVYNIYSVSNDTYQIWQSAFYSSYIVPGQFTSTNFDFIQQFYNSMKLSGNGFTMTGAGQSSTFNISDLGLSMNVKVNSVGATQANLTLNISTMAMNMAQANMNSTVSSTQTSSIQASSTVNVGSKQIAVASLNIGSSNFIITVAEVKNVPNTSILTVMNDEEHTGRTYNIIVSADQLNGSVNTLGNYGNLAFGINFGQSSPFEIYAGISSKLAMGLDGYLLIGGPILSNPSDVNVYEGKLALVQYPDFKSNIISSGVLTVSASLTSISDFYLKYNGNLEYRIDDFLIGGELSYGYTKLSGNYAVNLYGSAGIVYDGSIFRLLYSPMSQNFKFEVNWGG